MKRKISFFITIISLVGLTSETLAGGFYLTPQHTRPLGRGGAFVAGADGVSALWYNPAAIGNSGRQLELGANLNLLSATFQRVDEWGQETYPEVNGNAAPLPIPTIGYVSTLGIEGLSIGAGILAPTAVQLRWPETINNDPAPQRYSLISMDGSLLSMPTVAIAYEPIDGLRLGGAFYALTGVFSSTTMISSCDGGITCLFPEDPAYDALAQVTLENIFAPIAGFGLTYQHANITFGASAMLPFRVKGQAQLQTRLPSAVLFDGTELDGDTAEMAINFPLIARTGLQIVFSEQVLAELALVYEGWHVQEQIEITPNNVWIRGITGIGDYQVGPMSIERQMQDVWSVRAGGEYLFTQNLTIRSGFTLENGAFDDPHLTPLTLDTEKAILAAGLTYTIGQHWNIDAVLGHSFMLNREVRSSVMRQMVPIRPPRPGDDPDVYEQGDPTHVGNGDYTLEANHIGLSLRWTPDLN